MMKRLIFILYLLSFIPFYPLSSAFANDLDQAIVHYNQGYAYYKKGEYDAAIEELNKSLEFDPDNENAFYGLGNCYYRKQLYERAIEAYKKAVAINEDFANAHYGLGTAYSAMRKTDEADKEFTIYRRLKTGQTRITGTISHADQGSARRSGAGAESKEGKIEKPSSKPTLSEPETRPSSISVPRQEESRYPGTAPKKGLKDLFSIMAVKAPKGHLVLIANIWKSSFAGKIIIGIIGYLVLIETWLAMVAFQGLLLWKMRGRGKI